MLPYTRLNNIEIFGVPGGVEPWFFALAVIVFIASYIILSRKEKGHTWQKDALMFGFILGFGWLFGRLVYAIFEAKNFWYFFNFAKLDGIVSWGVIIGGSLGILFYLLFCKKKNIALNFAQEADKLVIGGALAIAIARIGCFLDGHLVGAPTTLPWGIYKFEAVRHPVGLYLSLSSLLIFFLLIIFFGKEKTKKNKLGKRFDGEVATWFLPIYCFNRFWIEFLIIGHNGIKIDSRLLGLNLWGWICYLFLVYLLIHLVFSKHHFNIFKR
ncbi:MAG: prolipoprotein diacylglyceryl transferase [Nanoarchaeota archaeon]|nr:prolipoprotein diacylglyceryl transferase [Nanoarchaeota archaeon]